MRILFPGDYFSPNKPDEMYLNQFNAFKSKGFWCSIINLNKLSQTSKIIPALGGEITLYRGWMLEKEEYQTLCHSVKANNGIPFTSLESYLSVHYLPNWYEKIKDLTPETVIFNKDADMEYELNKLGWEKFFVKDYVKSLKTSVGSVIESAKQIKIVLKEMEKFRGKIEGGICVRRFENFVPNTEERYFVIYGNPYASDKEKSIPDIVKECACRIDSKFFSIDIIKNKTNEHRIVEIGDGQVSDIVGWKPERFVEIWENHN